MAKNNEPLRAERISSDRKEKKAKCCAESDDIKIKLEPRAFSNKPRQDLPAWPDKRAYQYFTISIDFGSDGPCACRCCQYRQYVRGKYTKNGKRVDFELPDGKLNGRSWLEDAICDTAGHGNHSTYGHRQRADTDPLKNKSDPSDEYYDSEDNMNVDRDNGCVYRGYDVVSLPGNGNDEFILDLKFKGVVIDTCNKNRVMAKTYWDVYLENPP